MWCYNILGNNKGSISLLLQPYLINTGYFLLTDNLVVLKRENTEPILTFQIIEWRILLFFGRSIEDNPYRAKTNNVYFVHIKYITSP